MLLLRVLVEVELDRIILLARLLWQNGLDSSASVSLLRDACPRVYTLATDRRHRFFFCHLLETMEPVLRETAATAVTESTTFRFVCVLSVYRWRDLRIGQFTAGCRVLIRTHLAGRRQIRELLLVGSQGLERFRGQAAPRVNMQRLYFLGAATLPLRGNIAWKEG